jgi:hypothetical protein
MNCKSLVITLVCATITGYAWGGESVSYEQFSNLSLADQKSILVKAFNDRILHASNLYYQNTVVLETRKNDNGSEGEIMIIGNGKSPRRVFSHWQLGKDYKIIREAYLRDSSAPPQVSHNYWDASEGVLKGTFQSEDMPGRRFGRIDTQYNSVLGLNNCYTFFLVGGGNEETEPDLYLFPQLIENESGWVIVCLSEEGKIQLSFEFEPKGVTRRSSDTGKRTLVLDPDKNFMPVSGMMRRTAIMNDGEFFWREDSFYVEESQLVAHVWMPTKLKDVFRQSSPEILTDFHIQRANISEISHGTVTKADVTLKFSEGTEVVDVVQGISYKTDARGEPVPETIEQLYELDPSHVGMPQPEKRDRTVNWVLIIVGIVMIIIALYMMLRKRYAS